jgi:uncharacterized membrane protein
MMVFFYIYFVPLCLITQKKICLKDKNEHGKNAAVVMVAVVKLRTNKKKNEKKDPGQYECPILTGNEIWEEEKYEQSVVMAAKNREMEEQKQSELREMEEQEQANLCEIQRRNDEKKRLDRHYAFSTLKGWQNSYDRQGLEDELYDLQTKIRKEVFLN